MGGKSKGKPELTTIWSRGTAEAYGEGILHKDWNVRDIYNTMAQEKRICSNTVKIVVPVAGCTNDTSDKIRPLN